MESRCMDDVPGCSVMEDGDAMVIVVRKNWNNTADETKVAAIDLIRRHM